MNDRVEKLIELSSNLYDASSKNETEFREEIVNLKRAIKTLEDAHSVAQRQLALSIEEATRVMSVAITNRVAKDIDELVSKTNIASKRIERAAMFSSSNTLITIFGTFLLTGLLFWFLFFRNILTIEEIRNYRYQSDQLRSYGDVRNCGEYKCVQIKTDVEPYKDKQGNEYFLILPNE